MEDQLFFPRLRRHAKWMFVFLALIFGFGFVLFGIGAGGRARRHPARLGWRSGDTPSVSEARKADENPNDAAAWRELATALQTQGDTDEAIQAVTRYADLKPKDAEALRELGGLYLVRVVPRWRRRSWPSTRQLRDRRGRSWAPQRPKAAR